MSLKSKISIKLNNNCFELISKNNFNERDYVKIKSIKNNEARIFYVYSSKVLFGLYKIYYNDEDDILEDIAYSETSFTCLLCFELQKFIFEHFTNIPIDINLKNEIKRFFDKNLIFSLFDEKRSLPLSLHSTLIENDIYNNIYSIFEISKNLNINLDILEPYIQELENSDDDEVVNKISDNDKIKLLKNIKQFFENELNKYIDIKNKKLIFQYQKSYDTNNNDMTCFVYCIPFTIQDKNYNIFCLNYNYNLNNSKFNNLNYILGITENNSINEYGFYKNYFDNMYNKFLHIIYDDELFFSEENINSLYMNQDMSILFIGNISSFNLV